jgi:hypothetical protein
LRSVADQLMTSHALFGVMPRSVAEDILEFAHAEDKPLYRAAIEAVAKVRKLRPVFLERQPRNERVECMVGSLSRPGLEMAADGLIRSWLLKKHATVLVDFMDGLGIQHEKGVVNELPKEVEDVKLRNAIEGLLAKHPADVVALYLHAFNGMNGENWANLETALKSDSRLQWTPRT